MISSFKLPCPPIREFRHNCEDEGREVELKRKKSEGTLPPQKPEGKKETKKPKRKEKPSESIDFRGLLVGVRELDPRVSSSQRIQGTFL